MDQDQELDLNPESQPLPSDSPAPDQVREESPRSDDPGEQSLDERLDAEREEIAELEEANQETEEGEDGLSLIHI